MDRFVRYAICLLLMSMASNALAEKNKCQIPISEDNISSLKIDIAKKCKVGDTLYLWVIKELMRGDDPKVSIAASACDFSKSIVFDQDNLACIYKGISKTIE